MVLLILGKAENQSPDVDPIIGRADHGRVIRQIERLFKLREI